MNHDSKIQQFLKRATSDAAFAKSILERPQALFEELNLPAPPEGVEIKAVQNDSNTFHLVMPPSPNAHVPDEVLMVTAAGGKGGASSISTFPVTFSSANIGNQF